MRDQLATPSQVKTDCPAWTHQILSEIVSQAIDKHLATNNDELADSLHVAVRKLVERPMLQKVLTVTNNNQVQTAKMIGISRGTLRKKMKEHGLI